MFGAGLAAGWLLEKDALPPATAVSLVTHAEVDDVALTFGVANVTAWDEEYSDSVSASVDDVVKVQLTYENRGNIDRGVAVGFRLSEPHDLQQFVAADVDVDGERAELSVPVEVSLERSGLQVISDSVVWRHAGSTDGEAVEELLEGATSRLIEVERTSAGGTSSVTVLARVQARVVTIQVVASSTDHPDPATYINASPGGEIALQAMIGNAGNVPLRDVLARTNLASGMLYIPGSTTVERDGLTTEVGDDVVNSVDPTGSAHEPRVGLRLGDVAVGQQVRISWRVRLPQDADGHTFCAVAAAVAVGINEVDNTVAIGVPDVPTSCRGG